MLQSQLRNYIHIYSALFKLPTKYIVFGRVTPTFQHNVNSSWLSKEAYGYKRFYKLHLTYYGTKPSPMHNKFHDILNYAMHT